MAKYCQSLIYTDTFKSIISCALSSNPVRQVLRSSWFHRWRSWNIRKVKQITRGRSLGNQDLDGLDLSQCSNGDKETKYLRTGLFWKILAMIKSLPVKLLNNPSFTSCLCYVFCLLSLPIFLSLLLPGLWNAASMSTPLPNFLSPPAQCLAYRALRRDVTFCCNPPFTCLFTLSFQAVDTLQPAYPSFPWWPVLRTR